MQAYIIRAREIVWNKSAYFLLDLNLQGQSSSSRPDSNYK
jgi:hypothetical protein